MKEKDRGQRELSRKKPLFRRDLVEAKVQSLFPEQSGEILQLLDEYDPDLGEGASRLKLDILKLSGGDPEQLRVQIIAAKRDFRDVILMAENPDFLRIGMGSWLAMSDAEKDALSNRDVQQYIDWLQVPPSSLFSRLLSFFGRRLESFRAD